LSRPSTVLSLRDSKDVDARDKRGHDEVDGPSSPWPGQTTNRMGRTMVWPQYINGNPVIRCFMPGSMT
jgi:hypothetical protein